MALQESILDDKSDEALRNIYKIFDVKNIFKFLFIGWYDSYEVVLNRSAKINLQKRTKQTHHANTCKFSIDFSTESTMTRQHLYALHRYGT